MTTDLAFVIVLIYAIVESLEKFGLNRKTAHLLAIPLAIISSFAWLPGVSIKDHILKGLLIGIAAVGTCDSTCNLVDLAKGKLGSKEETNNKA